MSNGRIDFKNIENGTPFFLQDKIVNDNRTTFDNLKFVQQNTVLSNLFFSLKNVQIIQNALRAGVYNYSNKKYLIDEQHPDSLNIIMRAIFLQNSKNQPDNLTQQINELNKLVINYCVPKLYSEVEGYINYKRDASTLAVPLDNPITEYTDKTLELKKFF
jgi:hypothetical protein